MAERYSRERIGGTWPIYSAIHPDTHEQLEEFKARTGLTTSGAVHHILRKHFGLPPLRSLTDS